MNLTHMTALRDTLVEVYRRNLAFSINTWGRLPVKQGSRNPQHVAANAVDRALGIDPDDGLSRQSFRQERDADFCNTVACAAGWYSIIGRQVTGLDLGIEARLVNGSMTIVKSSNPANSPGIYPVMCEHLDLPSCLLDAMFMPQSYIKGGAVTLETLITRVEYVMEKYRHVNRESDIAFTTQFWHETEQWCELNRWEVTPDRDEHGPIRRHPKLYAIDLKLGRLEQPAAYQGGVEQFSVEQFANTDELVAVQ